MTDEYPPGWEPNDPPDDLDDLVREEWRDPAFREAWERQRLRSVE